MTTPKEKLKELKLGLNKKFECILKDFKPSENSFDKNEEGLYQLKERLSEQLKKLKV